VIGASDHYPLSTDHRLLRAQRAKQAMSTVRSYRDLKIWQKGIELVKAVYALTHKFPGHETYALADQLRRSRVSVPSNIAEGQARQRTGEFRRFLYIALGSAAKSTPRSSSLRNWDTSRKRRPVRCSN
jgi:hypothetical protein